MIEQLSLGETQRELFSAILVGDSDNVTAITRLVKRISNFAQEEFSYVYLTLTTSEVKRSMFSRRTSILKFNPQHHTNQVRGQQERRRGQLQKVDGFPRPQDDTPSLFKSDSPSTFRNVDELVTSGNQDLGNLDKVDFLDFRNNKELGQSTLKQVERDLTPFHSDRSGQEYRSDLSRVLNARYLQGHGVQVEAHLDRGELADLRLYLQKEESSVNIADAVRAVNTSLSNGTEDVEQLTQDAEQFLYTERGLSPEAFQEKFGNYNLKDLAKVRNFADDWSTSQSGKFLQLAQGESFGENRDSMARDMLTSYGYKNLDALDLDTVLSLLRDINAEGPNTNSSIRESVNTETAQGETDYFVLNTRANQGILEELGLSSKAFQKMDVSDEKYLEKFPDLAPREARAIRTRVLRDLFRVLPSDERGLVLAELQETKTNLIDAEKQIKKHLGKRIGKLVNGGSKFSKMGAMQRANFTTALKRLPHRIRDRAFHGKTPKQAKNFLEKRIESEFQIDVHRKAGQSPDGDPSFSPFVKDWTVQGLVDLYNAMNSMAKDGKLPQTLRGNSTVVYVEGSPSSDAAMSLGPQPINQDTVGPWDRPGSYAHEAGKSGYFGMAGPDETAHDTVYLFDDALKESNADSSLKLTIGDSTLIHEFGHAIQLGGTPGLDSKTRAKEDQTLIAEWSSLSDWNEPGQVLADGQMDGAGYYYDPTVQVSKRHEVATSYGASDPIEDYAEYAPYFFTEPETAMKLSPEKFLYFNEMVGTFYDAEQINSVANELNISQEQLTKAGDSMVIKVLTSAERAGLST